MATFTSVASGNWSDVDTWRTVSAWAATTNYAAGNFVKPLAAENGYVYEVTTDAGSSGGSEPVWPVVIGNTVVDDGITWTCRAGVPQDQDLIVVSAGHTVTVDVDMTNAHTGSAAHTNGIGGITITGHATTPGMLAFKADADGTYWLRMKTGCNIAGSGSATYFGRLMMGGGTWGSPAAPGVGRKQVIEFAGTGAGKITGRYLAGQLQSDTPANLYVETYKDTYTCDQATGINLVTNILTLATPCPVDGTAVRVKSSGTLPEPLLSEPYLYTRSGAGSTCKLAWRNNDDYIIELTSTGSGTLTLYTGHTDTATKTLNVVQNVTSDPLWTTTAEFNHIQLVDDATSSSRDSQADTLATITASTMVFTTTNVDSTQYPCSRIYLASRNVQIISRTNSNSAYILDLENFTHSDNNNWYVHCAIIGTDTSLGSKGIAINAAVAVAGVSPTISIGGVLAASYGMQNSTRVTISALICGQGSYGIYNSNYLVFTGHCCGRNTGIYAGQSCTFSGSCYGCGNVFVSWSYCTISTTIIGCGSAYRYVSHSNIAGTAYCIPNYILDTCAGNTITTTVYSAAYIYYYSSSVYSGTAIGCSVIAYRSAGEIRNAIIQTTGVCISASTITLRQTYVGASLPYVTGQSYVPYMGNNPSHSCHFDTKSSDGTVNYGSLSWCNQGGSGSSLAYNEGTHGDLQACGWSLPDPDWIHTSTFDTATLAAGAVTCPLWIDIPINAVDGMTIAYEACIKLSTTSDWTSLPRIQIIDQGLPWNSGGSFGEVLAETVHSGGSTNWELLTVQYSPTTERQIALRVVGTRTVRNGSFQWCYRQKMDYPSITNVKSGVSYGNSKYTGTSIASKQIGVAW